jgi:alpha-tubulin suppressor-like RCC1 family protein
MKPLANALACCSVLLATFGCGEEIQSPSQVKPAGGSGPAHATTATALSFEQVSAGGVQTCGVTTEQKAYCWGGAGHTGDGTTEERHRPVAVAGNLRFLHVSSGAAHVCGVTIDRQAYCWGANQGYPLGDGTDTHRLVPVPVVGGLRFNEVDAGFERTCGVTYPDNRAYCWGDNTDGALGDGTLTARPRPVAVVGTLRFRQVRTGRAHTCGLTTESRIYCWGSNREGQLGDSTEVVRRTKPALVVGGRLYRQLDAGRAHTCAVTTGFRAYCWGNGREGQIGNGRKYLSFWPRAVAGGLSFERVTGGFFHTCGESTTNRAYCWGNNVDGEVGDGTNMNQRLTPVAVSGGHFFKQVSVGDFYSCGRTDTAVAYCWGNNFGGILGDGTETDRSTPTAVAPPM